jgi:beta-galactosidase
MAYSNYPECELLVNGKSMGRQHKLTKEECLSREKAGDKLAMLRRYRFIWDNVKYEPGEITVRAYDETGKLADTKTIRTAGKPHHLRLTTDRESLTANGIDIAYVTVEVVDKDGNVCPHASDLVSFKVEGEGHFCAAANGDPTCLDRFQLPRHHVKAGKLSCLIESSESAGAVTLKASAGKLKGQITIPVK